MSIQVQLVLPGGEMCLSCGAEATRLIPRPDSELLDPCCGNEDCGKRVEEEQRRTIFATGKLF